MNDYFVKKDIGELILIQEAYQEGKIAEIAARIAANPGKKIVMIAGPSFLRKNDLFSPAFDPAGGSRPEAPSNPGG